MFGVLSVGLGSVQVSYKQVFPNSEQYLQNLNVAYYVYHLMKLKVEK